MEDAQNKKRKPDFLLLPETDGFLFTGAALDGHKRTARKALIDRLYGQFGGHAERSANGPGLLSAGHRLTSGDAQLFCQQIDCMGNAVGIMGDFLADIMHDKMPAGVIPS